MKRDSESLMNSHLPHQLLDMIGRKGPLVVPGNAGGLFLIVPVRDKQHIASMLEAGGFEGWASLKREMPEDIARLTNNKRL